MRRDEIFQCPAPRSAPSPATSTPLAAAAAALSARTPYSLDPSRTFTAEARARAAAARRVGRGGPREIVVDIAGEIDAAMADRVEGELKDCMAARQVVLMIDSVGGCVEAAKRIHRAVRRHPAEKRQALITGKCHSAAVLVAVAADYREAVPGASVLMHRTARPPEICGRWTAAAYARNALALEEIDEQLLDIMVARTGAGRAALAHQESNERPTPLIVACGLGILHAVQGLRALNRTFFDARMNAQANFNPGSRRAGPLTAIVGAPRFFQSDAYLAACFSAPEDR